MYEFNINNGNVKSCRNPQTNLRGACDNCRNLQTNLRGTCDKCRNLQTKLRGTCDKCRSLHAKKTIYSVNNLYKNKLKIQYNEY